MSDFGHVGGFKVINNYMRNRRYSSPLGTPRELQQAIMDWVDWDELSYPLMVTPTCHQERGQWNTALTPARLKKQLGFFVNQMNRKVMGNAANRFGRKLYVFSAIELAGSNNLHGHLIIDCPRPELESKFPRMLRAAWKNCYWGDQQIDIKKCYDKGALEYVTKPWTKPNYLDSFDWKNIHMPWKQGADHSGLLNHVPSLAIQPKP